MLGPPVDLAVPRALALPLADAVDAVGTGRARVTGVVIASRATWPRSCCCCSGEGDAATLVQPARRRSRRRAGDSALGEIGNIVGASYLNALAR